MEKNHHLWRLARTPEAGWPVSGDFGWNTEEIPVPADGQLLSRTIYLSMDPYQWMRRRTGVEKPGDICHGRTVSQVVESRHTDFEPGDYLFNTNGWAGYGLTGKGVDYFNYMLPRKLDPDLAPLSTAIGVLGMLGLTAWAGTTQQCEPQSGETFVVSAASGGVGQIAGQIARLKGCRVVGIAGNEQKCHYVVNELGFDACVSHLSDTLADDLGAACPDGVDCYFENVGGRVFEAVAPLLNRNSRISVCGLISQYGNPDPASLRRGWNQTGKPVFERQKNNCARSVCRQFCEGTPVCVPRRNDRVVQGWRASLPRGHSRWSGKCTGRTCRHAERRKFWEDDCAGECGVYITEIAGLR